ncbi:MAG: TonB-dependent receptor, partial [Bacteroidia bacterium]
MIRILTLTLLLFNFFLEAQVLCRGKITDFETGEPLIGALISIRERSLGVTTDAEGRYLLKLEAGNYTLQVQYLGYASINVPMQIKKNTLQNFALVPVLNELDEVLIQDQNPARQLKSTEMSVAKLDIKQINKIPALLGEVDIVRALQLLPGISTMGEGASGLNVRGGNSDQNLILLDDAPVYNSSHLFGFFSIFNPDAVKDVKLYKGGIPAAYGGRASSLIDVRMKESSAKRPTVNGGIGTVFSRISIEMPLIKDKAGILIALRRSYLDALVKPFVPEQNPLKNTTFYFYDLTAKAHWMINPKNTISLSSYIGRDVFGASIFSFDWGNKTLSLRWNHVFNSKWVWRTTAFYSYYN